MIKMLFAAMCVTISLTQMASAEDVWRSPEVARQMKLAIKGFADRGYTETAWGKQDDLAERAKGEYTINLDAGDVMAFIGVCDGCTDMDLQLLDPSGKAVAADQQSDHTPIVTITATTGGDYTLRAIMVHCPVAQCSLGVKAFWKK